MKSVMSQPFQHLVHIRCSLSIRPSYGGGGRGDVADDR